MLIRVYSYAGVVDSYQVFGNARRFTLVLRNSGMLIRVYSYTGVCARDVGWVFGNMVAFAMIRVV
jgi:hypothetical protein